MSDNHLLNFVGGGKRWTLFFTISIMSLMLLFVLSLAKLSWTKPQMLGALSACMFVVWVYGFMKMGAVQRIYTINIQVIRRMYMIPGMIIVYLLVFTTFVRRNAVYRTDFAALAFALFMTLLLIYRVSTYTDIQSIGITKRIVSRNIPTKMLLPFLPEYLYTRELAEQVNETTSQSLAIIVQQLAHLKWLNNTLIINSNLSSTPLDTYRVQRLVRGGVDGIIDKINRDIVNSDSNAPQQIQQDEREPMRRAVRSFGSDIEARHEKIRARKQHTTSSSATA